MMESAIYSLPAEQGFQPLTEPQLLQLLSDDQQQLDPSLQAFWQAISLQQPELWQQHPYGDEGCGFWVVAVCGQQCLYYNDICGGFSISSFQHWNGIDHFQPEAGLLAETLKLLLKAN